MRHDDSPHCADVRRVLSGSTPTTLSVSMLLLGSFKKIRYKFGTPKYNIIYTQKGPQKMRTTLMKNDKHRTQNPKP